LQNSQFGIICWGTLDHMDMMWNILQKKKSGNSSLYVHVCIKSSSFHFRLCRFHEFVSILMNSWHIIMKLMCVLF
jgi:hypothetical protein